ANDKDLAIHLERGHSIVATLFRTRQLEANFANRIEGHPVSFKAMVLPALPSPQRFAATGGRGHNASRARSRGRRARCVPPFPRLAAPCSIAFKRGSSLTPAYPIWARVD